jgi:DNA helicase II / ATP-dependent DNA helicase PcrA
MYVGMTRARKRLRLMYARSRFLWGQNKSGAPSRFLDDLPDDVVERRSDELLSAFAWAGRRERRERAGNAARSLPSAGGFDAGT